MTMDIVLNISIFYDCKIAESGYEVKFGKLNPRIKNSRYLTKSFDISCIKDFKSIFMNDKYSDDELDKKREKFANLWGVFSNEDEKQDKLDSIIRYIIDLEDCKKNKKLPHTSDHIKIGWKFTFTGKLLPVIDTVNLYQAIKIALQLNSEIDELKICNYYLNFGEKTGCLKSFKPKRSDAIFCSSSCRDHYHKKQIRRNISSKKVTKIKKQPSELNLSSFYKDKESFIQYKKLNSKNIEKVNENFKNSRVKKKYSQQNSKKGEIINSFIQFPILKR